MMRWQSFSELISLRQAMEKLFEDSFVTPSCILNTVGSGAALILRKSGKNIQKLV
ncbi:hypothetical protein ES705_28552 [subsurface metagenome]